MKFSSITGPVVLAGSMLVFSSACLSSLSMKESGGPEHVDELLSRVERVQIDVVLAKERSHEALGALQVLAAPGFRGDPVAAHAKLVEAIESSEIQGKKLDGSIRRMRDVADEAFRDWMADLESFGNTKMRQRSQTRLSETRLRYEAVMNSAIAVQIAYHALNADLNDHALFLENDFNADALAMIAEEVEGLGSRSKELDQRIDACATAARSYVESAALPGQLDAPSEGSQSATGKKTEGSR